MRQEVRRDEKGCTSGSVFPRIINSMILQNSFENFFFRIWLVTSTVLSLEKLDYI